MRLFLSEMNAMFCMINALKSILNTQMTLCSWLTDCLSLLLSQQVTVLGKHVTSNYCKFSSLAFRLFPLQLLILTLWFTSFTSTSLPVVHMPSLAIITHDKCPIFTSNKMCFGTFVNSIEVICHCGSFRTGLDQTQISLFYCLVIHNISCQPSVCPKITTYYITILLSGSS